MSSPAPDTRVRPVSIAWMPRYPPTPWSSRSNLTPPLASTVTPSKNLMELHSAVRWNKIDEVSAILSKGQDVSCSRPANPT